MIREATFPQPWIEEPEEGVVTQVIHQLKTLPQYFQEVRKGTKTFEVRKNDRDYQVGDTLMLDEWDEEQSYSGETEVVKVTYVLTEPEFVKEGYAIMGIKLL